MCIYINTNDILQWGLFWVNNYILVIAALNDVFSACVIIRVGSLRVETGGVWVKMAAVEQCQDWRLERSSVAFLVVYMWVGLLRSVDQGVYVDLGCVSHSSSRCAVWVKHLCKYVDKQALDTDPAAPDVTLLTHFSWTKTVPGFLISFEFLLFLYICFYGFITLCEADVNWSAIWIEEAWVCLYQNPACLIRRRFWGIILAVFRSNRSFLWEEKGMSRLYKAVSKHFVAFWEKILCFLIQFFTII